MPRHQYSPEDVVYAVLIDDRLYRICELVFFGEKIVHASYIAKELGMNPGYVYKLMRKLEKWGILKGFKDPVNGKLAFKPSNSRATQLPAEELKKRKVRELGKILTNIKLETKVSFLHYSTNII